MSLDQDHTQHNLTSIVTSISYPHPKGCNAGKAIAVQSMGLEPELAALSGFLFVHDT